MIVFRTNLVLCVVLLITLLAGPLSWSQEAGSGDITAVGVAAGNTSSARDEALEDALRRAVQLGLKDFVGNRLSTDCRKIAEKKIYPASHRYIEAYKIIREGLQDGIYEVEIVARLRSARLTGDLQSIGALIQEKRNPRVMVLIYSTEIDSSFLGVTVEGNRQVENQAERRLLQKGFTLVDASQVDRKRRLESLLVEGDSSEAAELAQDFGAEILIMGEVRRSFVGTRSVLGRDMRFFSNEVRIRAMETDSTRILYSGYQTRPPSGVDALLPLEEATSEILDEMIASIRGKWQKDVFQGGTYQLDLSVATFDELSAFEEGVQQISGVWGVLVRRFLSGRALLEVEYQGTLVDLAEEISCISAPKSEIIRLHANSIEVKIIH